MRIPKKEVKIKSHLFLLIFSLRIKALASIPKGIASWDPKIIGAIIEEWYKDKFINTYTNTPIEIEKNIRGLTKFFLGNLKFQNGKSINKTRPILKEAINIGGTELFNANFAIGKALPCATIMKINIVRCLSGNFKD